MGAVEDPFEGSATEEIVGDFVGVAKRPRASQRLENSGVSTGACVAHFYGFDIEDRPLVTGIAQYPGEVLPARATVPLLKEAIGSEVVVLCENGDPQRPIIVGVMRQSFTSGDSLNRQKLVKVEADEDRYVISAEREIVLRCGDSSITLTRAGKVIIKGNYILSRSTGYNKIKGAAVDIN